MALFATALACTALSAGCGGPPTAPAPAPAARPASHFAIAFERTGGLKASVETLRVRPGLRAVATAPKGSREASRRFKMSAENAEELRRELAKARFAELPSTPTGTCADCYVYSIAYHGHEIHFPDSKVPESLMEVVDGLEEEVISHLYRHVGYRRG
jgi:hypothetical protein